MGFLYCFLGAVFLQIVLSTDWRILNWQNHLILLLGLVIILINHKKRAVLFLFFCLIGIWSGIFLVNRDLAKIYLREEIEFSGYGYVFEEPELQDDYQKLIFCPITESSNYFKPQCQEKILFFNDLETNYYLGEIVKIDCQLKNPENKYPKFNYIKFLSKDDIYQICQGVQIQKIEKDSYKLNWRYKVRNLFYKTILNCKKNLENNLNLVFSYPESAYLAGLLLGGEDRLPENIQENFRRTGTTHTIAVSGYNITILASFFMGLGILIGFYRQKAFWLAVLGIIFFVLMIGSPSSAVRAAIMGILLLWASKKGRLADSVATIVLAGALMITKSPLIIIYDAGFQLSFLASLSIVSLYGPLSEKFNIKNDFLELKSIFLVTIVAQIGVLGIILYSFETFSPVSFLANLIILPAIPAIMLFGFLALVTSFLSSPLALFIALPVQAALSLIIWIIAKLSQISWASLEIGDIGILGLIGYYLLFFGLIFYVKNKTEFY